MTELRGQPPTRSAAPVWEGHLALDAIVAFVDDELTAGARSRALRHLAGCAECGAEVVAQTQARVALRRAEAPSLPSSLLSSLRAIPVEAELPDPPAGLAVGPDGELVSVLREPRDPGPRAVHRAVQRRFRLGTGAAVMTGLALGGLVATGATTGSGSALTASAGIGASGPAPVSVIRPAPGRSSGALLAEPVETAARPVPDARLRPLSGPSADIGRIPLAPSPPTVHRHHG